ncbi:unnamed protein product [Effrenium voratum]|nr:unnamed protein product [Effrenium voratum]
MQSRAQLVSGRYAVAEGRVTPARALGSLFIPFRLVALCWVGDAKLLAVTETGSLLWASVDSVRGLDAWNQALWKTDAEYDVSVNAVQQLQAVSEADNLVGLMVDEIDGLYCILARVEVTSSALSLQRVFSAQDEVLSALRLNGWLLSLKHEAGQLALWSPPQIAVMTLESADSTVETLAMLLEKCPGPKAMARSLPDVQEGEVFLDQKGRLVEYPAGAWRVAVPSSRIDCPKTLTKVEATAERSVEGAARTTVWIEKELKMNGDSLNCTDELAKLLRLGPGQALDRAVGLTGAKPRNEAFLKEQGLELWIRLGAEGGTAEGGKEAQVEVHLLKPD